MNITAVIPFCSYDEHFFKLCVGNLLECGLEVIVMTCDHLWGGELENEEILNRCNELFRDNPRYRQIKTKWVSGKGAFYHEASARHIGSVYSDESSEYILFIDIDEIVDPVPFLKWLDKGYYKRYRGMKFRCYMYSIKPEYQLRIKWYSTVMCKRWYALRLEFKEEARLQFINNNNKISRWLMKLRLNPFFYMYSKVPFIHHYTSVRTKEQMLKKVENWGHKNDRTDWSEVVTNMMVEENRIGGYEFKVVENKFNIQL